MVLDDGPHTLESMETTIILYLPLLAADGILIIEDVQEISWFEQLISVVPAEVRPAVQTYDRRDLKNKYDDLIFVIDKSTLNL